MASDMDGLIWAPPWSRPLTNMLAYVVLFLYFIVPDNLSTFIGDFLSLDIVQNFCGCMRPTDFNDSSNGPGNSVDNLFSYDFI